MYHSIQEKIPVKTVKVKLKDIFISYLKISMCSLGGGLSNWTQIVVVEQRKWLSNEEFLCMLALCRIVPGSNQINLAISLGRKLRGKSGIIAALMGLILVPFFLVLGLGNIYLQFQHAKYINEVFYGLSIAAIAMTFSMGVKSSLHSSLTASNVIMIIIVFLTIGIFRWPLLWVMLVLIPVNIGIAWVTTKRNGTE